MATDLENIATRLGRIYAELAGLKTIAADQAADMTFTEGGQTYSFNEYAAFLGDQAEKFEKLYGQVQNRTQGPFNVNTGTVRG